MGRGRDPMDEPFQMPPEAEPFDLGTGPTGLLMVHGFADLPYLWSRLAPRLAESGRFACRAMRLPGAGEPPRDARTHGNLAAWRAAVDRELSYLRAGRRRVWIAGHSLGGALALDAALRRPDDVAGLVLFAPLVRVSSAHLPLLPAAWYFRLMWLALRPFGNPLVRTHVIKGAGAHARLAIQYPHDVREPLSVYTGLFRLIAENDARRASLRCPIRVFLAAHDHVTSSAAARRWFARVPGPHEVTTVPGSGHVIPLEPSYPSLVEPILAFTAAH